MTAKTTKQPLSDNTRKLIIIIAIILVAVIVLSIALALILKEDVKVPADENNSNNGTSNLPIENGDFKYFSSSDTGYPYTATDWTKYGYKDGASFESIATNEKSVMGIVNLDEWAEVEADLKDAGVTSLQKPSVHKTLEDDPDVEEHNIYMIHNKVATAASILSDQVSVASGASVRITVWLNMAQVDSGNAVIMIQKSSPTFPTDEYRYAYNYQIQPQSGDDVDENGWQKHEFYFFNRETSTQYIKVSVGLGSAYDKDRNATGTMFVDDITYETVTANEYRIQVDNDAEYDVKNYKPYKIIENEDIKDETSYLELVADNTDTKLTAFESYADFDAAEEVKDKDGHAYLPFTNRDDFGPEEDPTGFKLYKVSQIEDKVIALRLHNPNYANGINLESSPINKDHYHVSFWVRIQQNNGHQATEGNVYVQKMVNGKWEDITTDNNGKKIATFAEITTSQEVDKDANCGWVKYDVYLKPSTAEQFDISILFVLGNKDGYKDDDVTDGMVPQGSLYVTSPAYEVISSKDYTNASTGPNVDKINLVGSSASTSVTNGSFTDVNNVGNQPTGWTPVFAGDNAIYKDGLGDKMPADHKQVDNIVGSGIVKDGTQVNDSQGHALSVKTNNTNFGYISNDITLSSRTVYVFSVMAKVVTGTHPYIYLINTAKDTREAAIVAKVESTYTAENKTTLDGYFDYSLSDDVLGGSQNSEWTRYYIIYITENESATVRLALFNGKINETEDNYATGEIIYDNVKLKTLGTYSIVDSEDENATQYDISFSASKGYDKAIEDLVGDNKDGSLNTEESEILSIIGDGITQPAPETWEKMRVIPKDEDNNGGNEEENPTKTPANVDWGLLMSVISSIMLVAALLIVFVIKVFQSRRNRVI